MADVNVLDLTEVTPSTSSDDLILFDKTTGEAKAARYPTIGNATLTIQKNGTTVKTFTANATSNVTCNITMAKGDVGLGNVGNFKAVSTAASQGLSATEQTNARNNISAGSASDLTAVANKVSLSSDAYSTSELYSPGEVCIYDNKLYVCHTRCTPAAWSVNKSCFSQTSLTAQVSTAIHWDRTQDIKGAFIISTSKKLSEISVGEYCNHLGFSTRDTFLLNIVPKKMTTAGLFDLCIFGNNLRKIQENGIFVLNYDDLIVEEITLATNASFAADEVKSYAIPAKSGYASYLMFPYVTGSWADKYAVITSYVSANGFGIWNRASSAYTWTVKATVLRKKTY